MKTYIIFDYYLEGYFRATFLHDGYLFLRNEFANENAFLPIDEAKQKEILQTQRHEIMDNQKLIDWMDYEIATMKRKLQ